MRTVDPLHPGETLREDLLPELGLTVTEAAQQLGVTRTALSRVLNGHAVMLRSRLKCRYGWSDGWTLKMVGVSTCGLRNKQPATFGRLAR